MSDEEREEKELDLTSPEVVTKYKSAAEIVNKALQLVLSGCKPKTKIVDLCEKGDAFITEQTGNMYKNVKKKIERGVAFPTCISVNNTVCHFSPLAGDELVLEEGDMLKIDMGCHIDGFIAVVAHTHMLQTGPVTGRAADVLAAANTAAEVALRLVRPGRKNKDVTDAIQKVAAAYDCKIVEGVLSHQMKQFVIDGNKVVLSVSGPETRVDDAEFEENEVYAVDIVTSTGDGKPKLLDEKQTTIYKRAVDKNYHLKMKASRFIFSEINQNFPIMPFTARALEEKRARLGLLECVNHDLLQPYPVLYEKPGDLVARIKFTVLLMPNGSDRITSHPLQELNPTKTTAGDAEIKSWLTLPVKSKKKGGPPYRCDSETLDVLPEVEGGSSWWTSEREMESESGKSPQAVFLNVLKKAKGKRKEKQPSVELPPTPKRTKLIVPVFVPKMYASGAQTLSHFKMARDVATVEAQGKRDVVKEAEAATLHAEELSKREEDHLAHIKAAEARDPGIRDFLDKNARDEWLKRRRDEWLKIYKMGFVKAKEIFAERFPDIPLDDFVMPAVVSPSRETVMPSEGGDVPVSHPLKDGLSGVAPEP
ncbi:hypothetical protein RJ639_018956 [Escallonia herrerae]|uniref:ERBB-3 BINDING PROTEIN 1 n=1 Tax=Escallonia herrerae TaxID=1293975 RepID=A0AA89AIW5_9ASTE|nr:hypothetical protein RJ639_018956 [Escallonia herrerae]